MGKKKYGERERIIKKKKQSKKCREKKERIEDTRKGDNINGQRKIIARKKKKERKIIHLIKRVQIQ